MENKQTALDWIVQRIIPSSTLPIKTINEFILQAKAMEKEQKQLDYIAGHDLCRCVTDHPDEALEIFEEYYNDTYGQGQND